MKHEDWRFNKLKELSEKWDKQLKRESPKQDDGYGCFLVILFVVAIILLVLINSE